MRTALRTILALTVTMTSFEEATAQELLVGELLGRLEVARHEQRIDLAAATWVSLPPLEAVEAFRSLQLMTRKEFDALVDGLKRKAFTIKGVYQDYALERAHGLIGDALEQGITKEETLERLGEAFDSWGLTRLQPYHAETVFDTNIASAYSHGRWEQQRRPGALRLRPFWQYKTIGDKDVRPTHEAMDGRVFPADHEVWRTWYPPNGFRCRCSIFSLSRRDVEREGIEVQTKLPRQVEVGTGVYELIPDMGFAGSPADWMEDA